MESPVVYLPTDRRHALAAGTPLPDRVTGAVLFADLSGFTALTEALVQELGPKRGAEELSRQLNAIYSSLIAEVDQRRGSVISFAGDAITCFFAGDAGRQAIACGLALQAALRPFARLQTPAGAVIMLALKVAVTAGPVRRFQVGDPAIQYLDVLAGRTLDRLAALEHVAEKGEVVVGAEVVDQLDAAAGLSRPVPGGAPAVVVTSPPAEGPAAAWPPLPPAALADHAVRAWLLPGVFERTRQGHFLAEIRPAVMLFLQFGGIHYDDDEAAWSKLDQFVRWAQSVLDRYGGVLLQLTTGDKGSSFYGAFGAPIAHDDDAARAAAAALELRALPEGLSFLPSVKIGLSQGRIWAGPYGGPTRRTYGVLGDEVNVAARLMAAAQPGQALVSERLARSLSAVFELQSVGALELKGKREPVATAELLGRRGAGQ
ncbi:MAG: adenylate/guanylate cyclase domain-containing protein, partial [Anaerolineales bacterium]|nr:adenylate/guanylate cyclase domain-containing protein [Anaerolineales bacterium]